jgi:hypothetical protein
MRSLLQFTLEDHFVKHHATHMCLDAKTFDMHAELQQFRLEGGFV